MKHRTHYPQRSRSTVMIFVWLCTLLVLLSSSSLGKEIEVTAEWTLLGENDTIPAGMHVRMDMTTGEKWVKLPDEEDENTDKVKSSAKASSSTSVTITGDSSSDESIKSNNERKTEEKAKFDYEMMHRTLSKLPPEEHERMGGLPELPNDEAIDPKVREAFEKRMEQIWIQRQAELQVVQEENVVDLPDLLKDRIGKIKDYLVAPSEHLAAMDLDKSAPEIDPEDDEVLLGHIVAVLQDLEYHLSDLDMTRDFHTLGGWPLLTSLLSDSVHDSSNQTSSTTELKQKKNVVQAHAAWAIGTAVKNHEEFYPYSVEEILIENEKTTATELLLRQLNNEKDEDPPDKVVSTKRQKVLYALGALLRGNRKAQAHFVEIAGPSLLGQTLRDFCQEKSVDAKLTKRILALADDIITDINLHSEEQGQLETTIIRSFSDDAWCESAFDLLEKPSFQETALRAVRSLAPYCEWQKDSIKTSILSVQEQWESSAAETDPDHMQERLDLVKTTLTAVEAGQ